MADFHVPYKFSANAKPGTPLHPKVPMRYVVPDLSEGYFRKDVAHKLGSAIDKFALDKWDDGFRNHLGASLIGQECTRKTYYGFHWMAKPNHSGRMQRLFQRGHLEEFRYVEYLEGIGVKVWALDPATGKQFRVSRIGGHFGGSLDAIISLENWGIPGYMLGEFKTKGAGKDGKAKSFLELKEKGIMLTNPQHYDQMSTYGWNYTLNYSLYMSTNKNDDDMHIEIVPLNFPRAQEVEQKAAYIIALTEPPPRISLNPAYFTCKGCEFHAVCHGNRVPAKNCRSCNYSRPVEGAAWYCTGHRAIIPDHVIPAGCPQWDFIKSPPG